ncbi:MAG TPA: AraC family transcriptional regulator [Bryobacteraceae bacterium]|nr:AraC family transcriptional regulator [Bryobacteraceae bacterium]
MAAGRRAAIKEYQDRVNRVLDYIGEHLDEELSLKRLSRIACFSPFHFHRIFQGVTGETLNSHVRRVRLERAALLLRTSPEKRITDVALETGFAGTAEFSRAFKNHFNRTASSWDRRSPLENSKICKDPQAIPFHTGEELERWKRASNARLRVGRYEDFRYVYHRIYAPFAKGALLASYETLIAWLKQRGTDLRNVVLIGMSIDDPSITPPDKYRYDLGVAFPQTRGGILAEIVQSQGEFVPGKSECAAAGFTVRDFPAQPVVAFRCAGGIDQVGYVWQYLYRIWLPSGGYAPADLPAMELFVRTPEEIGWETYDLEACIPVERL